MTSPISSYRADQPSTLGVSSSAPAAGQTSGSAQKTAPAAAGSDTATITPLAQLSAFLLTGARNAPGVDTAAVSRLQSAIQGGSYNPPAEQVAGAIQMSALELPKG
ncbi:flagellar biosynthesis anti-sigma factor FlgM [Acidisoma sp. C75]